MTPNIRRNERPETGNARSRNRLAAAALRLSLLLTALVVSALALPATALAECVAPIELWVGCTNVVQGGYWKTNEDGTLTVSESNDYNVYYDGNGNLWLNNANIVGQGSGLSEHKTTGIYAYYDEWVDTDIALTIHLTGDNSVSNGYPIYVAPWGGSASLTITGQGSLTATGTYGGNGGIFVKGDTSSLTIEKGADVTVNCARSSAVTIVADDQGTGTLTVDNATLRAYGYVIDDPDDPYGICFSYAGSSSDIVDGSRVLRVSGNSIVYTNYMQATYTRLVVDASEEDGGIVFDGKDGTVYGNVTLQEDLEIGEGESLTIPQDATLTIPGGKTLTNNGALTIAEGGEVINNSALFNDGSVKVAGSITNNHYIYNKEGGTFSGTGGLNNNNADSSGYFYNFGDFSGITVTGNTIQHFVTGVTLTGSLSMAVGGTETLTASLTPSDATERGMTWTSSDPTIATVTENPDDETEATITALKPGTVTITAKADNLDVTHNKPSATCEVTVSPVPVTGVSLNKTETDLTVGSTETLTATVQPTDATNQNVTWSSDNENVATVENGKVTAVGTGSTTITVTTEDGGKTATCTVTVHDPVGAWSSNANGHWHACAACGDRLDYAEHTSTVENEKKATCTEEGYTGDTVCSVCGFAIAKGETIPATGHSFTSYAPNGDATCTEDGTETAACDNGCGATDTRSDEGSALGHAWSEPAWRWSDDGEEFVASFACENDPSHTLELTAAPTSEVASEPTCTEPGTTRYRAEVELDGVTYAAEATAADIPARGHKFEDGVCTVCGAEDEGYVAPQRPDPRPEPEPVETDPELPTTGDATAVGLLGALACGGAALAIGAALRMRSR